MSEPLTRLQRLTYRVWLAVGVLVLGAAVVALLARPLAVVIAPLVVALLIVHLLNPVVTALSRRGVPRLIGTLIAYVGVGVVIALASVLLAPVLTAQLASFAEEAPDLGLTLKERLGEALTAIGIDVDLTEIFDARALGEELSAFVAAEENRSTITSVLTVLSGLARSAFTVVFGVVIGPVVAFYVLADLPSILGSVRRIIPPDRRAEVEQVSRELSTVVGAFIRGQLIVATFVGIATSIALGLIGLPYSLLIGFIAGVTNLVPLLGPFVAGVLAVTVALVTDGVGLALLVLVIMTGVQQLESSVLNPLIMGRVVRVHPLALLLGVIVAAALYGVFGMLVVVPLLAGARVLSTHLWRTRVPWAQALPADRTAGLAVETGDTDATAGADPAAQSGRAARTDETAGADPGAAPLADRS
jgi:predicted PurR-regulated permease PerM